MPAVLRSLAAGCVNPNYAVAFTGTPTGGSFTLYFLVGVGGPGEQTLQLGITYSASLTAASVQTQIQAVSGLGAVTVTGTTGGPFLITTPSSLGATVVTAAWSLTGGTAPAVVVTGVGVETALYTVGSSPITATKLSTLSLCNMNTLSSGVTAVSLVPTGRTADGTSRVLHAYTHAAHDTISADDVLSGVRGAVMEPGAKISLNSTLPIVYVITGAEVH